jgi:hypothetical protein
MTRKPNPQESLLSAVARTLGYAAGSLAAITHVAGNDEPVGRSEEEEIFRNVAQRQETSPESSTEVRSRQAESTFWRFRGTGFLWAHDREQALSR